MQTFKSFLDQSLLIWKDSTAAARLGLAILLVICVGGVVGVGYWSLQPHYVTLANGLDAEKLGKVADALDKADISYTYKGSSSIQVDKRKLPQAKRAAGDLGIQGGDLALDSLPMWGDPSNISVINRRNREKELKRAIEAFEGVESADVLLNIPEREKFLRLSAAPSASVSLKISNGAKFGESQAAAIAKLVASSTSGLTVEQVAITDRKGNVYSSDQSLGQLSSQEEFRVMRDRELTQKAEWLLSPVLGFGNAFVTVTTDYTFPEGTLDSTEYDEDKKGITKEMIKNETITDINPISAGVSGSGSNVDSSTTSIRGKQPTKTEKEDIENTFIPTVIRRTEAIRTPILNSMGVSVLVNKKIKEDTPETREKLLGLVQQAVNFREGKDQISIEFFDFVDPAPIEVPPAFALPWDKINELLKNVSLGVAAIIALLVARKAFMKIQPEPSASAEATDRATQVNQLSELVKQNPEVFSKIISSWSSLDADDDKSSSAQEKKAA